MEKERFKTAYICKFQLNLSFLFSHFICFNNQYNPIYNDKSRRKEANPNTIYDPYQQQQLNNSNKTFFNTLYFWLQQ